MITLNPSLERNRVEIIEAISAFSISSLIESEYVLAILLFIRPLFIRLIFSVF